MDHHQPPNPQRSTADLNNDLAKATLTKFVPGCCACMCLLLVTVVVAAVLTEWEEQCNDDYEDADRSNYGSSQMVLVRTCQENIELCGTNLCACQDVGDFGDNSSSYCDDPTLSPEGAWGGVFIAALMAFFCVLCGSPFCLCGHLILQSNQQRRQYNHNTTTTPVTTYPAYDDINNPASPVPIAMAQTTQSVARMPTSDPPTIELSARPIEKASTYAELPLATAEPIADSIRDGKM